MSSEPDDRQSDLAVMEANEYKQKRRLERILDARDGVEVRSQEAYGRYAAGEISREAVDITILRAVQSFIRELYNLLWEHRQEVKAERDDAPLPDIYLVMDQQDIEAVNDPLGQIHMAHDDNVVFWGLFDILNADEFYSETWTESIGHRHMANEERELSKTHAVPESLSWESYMLANRFLAEEKDVEIRFEDLDDSLPIWGFEEVEEDDEE